MRQQIKKKGLGEKLQTERYYLQTSIQQNFLYRIYSIKNMEKRKDISPKMVCGGRISTQKDV